MASARWDKRPVAELLDILDAADVRVYVDLDGGWGEDILETHLDISQRAARSASAVTAAVAWDQMAGAWQSIR